MGVKITVHSPMRLWPLLSEEEREALDDRTPGYEEARREIDRLSRLVCEERRIVRGKMLEESLEYQSYGSDVSNGEEYLDGAAVVHSCFPGVAHDEGGPGVWLKSGVEFVFTGKVVAAFSRAREQKKSNPYPNKNVHARLIVSMNGIEREFEGPCAASSVADAITAFMGDPEAAKLLAPVETEIAECSMLSR